MANVSVTINGRSYQIACDDGQEEHLTELADYIDRRIGELAASVGQIGDMRLMVMTSLLVADELSEAYSEIETLRGQVTEKRLSPAEEDALAETIETLAERIEDIAAHLEEA